MAINRWDTFRDVVALQNRMNSLFQDFSRNGENELVAAGFVPPVDIYEDEHKLVLTVEIPGLRLEDLDVRLENNTLTVKGERTFKGETKEENFHRVERRYGSFTRSFTLPTTVNTEDIKADYEQGVLKIRLAKRQEAKPKQIKVNIGTAKPVEGQKAEAKAQVA